MAATITVGDYPFEATAGDAIGTCQLQTPSGFITNTGANAMVVDFTALSPLASRTQPVGANAAFIPAGATVAIPFTCSMFSYQDSVGGKTTTFLVTKR